MIPHAAESVAESTYRTGPSPVARAPVLGTVIVSMVVCRYVVRR